MKNLLLCLLMAITAVSFAQNDAVIEEIFKKNTTYFDLDRDALHLHLNKSTYIIGDEVWFKVYISNRSSHTPENVVSNIYVRFLDAEGVQIERKLCFAQEGIANGSFTLDKNLASGTYYIQVYTTYTNNFIEDESFTTAIQVINPSTNTSTTTIEESYDIQLLPEGGHVVADVLNIMSCKILNAKGKGVFVTQAQVINDLGEQVATFKTNTSGLGKFTFTPKLGRTYKALVTINDVETQVDFPSSETTGVVLSASKHVTKDLLLVYLKTNQTTYKSIENKKFYVVIHQDKQAKSLTTSFTENSLQAGFVIPYKDLYSGTNTITVFDENKKPIAERLVFNHTAVKRIDPIIKMARVQRDSVKIELQTMANELGKPCNMSVSILPENTISNIGHENILTSLLIKPYIKGQVENPDQYFNKVTRKSLYNLDLLLLTQGWSKYNWNTIFNTPVQEHFKREQGISMNIKLNKSNFSAGTTLSVSSLENGIFESYEIKENADFQIKNYAFLDSSKVQFSLYRKGKASKAPVVVQFSPSQTSKTPSFKKFETKNQQMAIKPQKQADLASFFEKGEQLEEVIIKGVKRNTDNDDNLRGLTLGANGRLIDEETAKQFRLITDLIRTYGYQIARDINGRLTIKKGNRGKDSFVLETVVDPIIFLNGNQLQKKNLDILDGLRTSSVSKIYHKNRDNMYGRDGNAGVIHIYTKKNFGRSSILGFNEFIIPMGFTAEKLFYMPKYASFTSDAFTKYGVIGWQPNVYSDKEGEASFKILNTGNSKVQLFIQGMSADGSLVSKTQIVEVK